MKLTDSRGPNIDTQKCVEQAGGNRFDLVLIATVRARELSRRHKAAGHTTQVNAPVSDLAVVNGKLEKIRSRKEESRASLYGRDDTVSTSVVGRDQIDQARAEIQNLKKQKQKLNDEVLELNIKTEIPLSDDVVATLQTEGLV